MTPRFTYCWDRDAEEWRVVLNATGKVVARFGSLLQVEHWIDAEGHDLYPEDAS